MIKASIIVATYNRSHCIKNALNSILNEFKNNLSEYEVIVVDDASTDNTEDLILKNYKNLIDTQKIIYYKLAKNKGVAGARNQGVKIAKGEWSIFLDSDDSLLSGSGEKILEELKKFENHPVIFFRCLNQHNQKVGINFSSKAQYITLKQYLKSGSFGECLTAVKRMYINEVPFNEELRGYEGLTIARILKKSNKTALLSNIIVRRYNQEGTDRLSSRKGFLKRINLLSKGHLIMIKEFYKYMTFKLIIFYTAKYVLYKNIHYINKIVNKCLK